MVVETIWYEKPNIMTKNYHFEGKIRARSVNWGKSGYGMVVDQKFVYHLS